MRVSAKAPCRVDLAGATLDIWPLYLFHDNVVTVNFAVDRYTYCAIETRDDSRIVLRSRDLAREETFESLDAASYGADTTGCRLLALLVRFFAPDCGLTLESDSEAPAGAGISGSSALMISVASRAQQTDRPQVQARKDPRNRAERGSAGDPRSHGLRRITIRRCTAASPRSNSGRRDCAHGLAGRSRDDSNERFVLAYTGAPRNSGINNWEVMKGHIDGDKAIHRNFDRIACIAMAMRQAVGMQRLAGAAA